MSIKSLLGILFVAASWMAASAQSHSLYKKVGTYFPIRAMHLTTPDSCIPSSTLPEGVRLDSVVSYDELGMSLSHGIPCGNGLTDNYGIIFVSKNGYNIVRNHSNTFLNFDVEYIRLQSTGSSMILVPSMMYDKKVAWFVPTVRCVFIRTETKEGEQYGIVKFNAVIPSDEARDIILAANPTATDIFVLDSGAPKGTFPGVTEHTFMFF